MSTHASSQPEAPWAPVCWVGRSFDGSASADPRPGAGRRAAAVQRTRLPRGACRGHREGGRSLPRHLLQALRRTGAGPGRTVRATARRSGSRNLGDRRCDAPRARPSNRLSWWSRARSGACSSRSNSPSSSTACRYATVRCCAPGCAPPPQCSTQVTRLIEQGVERGEVRDDLPVALLARHVLAAMETAMRDWAEDRVD